MVSPSPLIEGVEVVQIHRGVAKLQRDGFLAALVAAALVVGCGVAAAGTVTYEYDALGRLKSATNAATGAKAAYDYDKAGNRTGDNYAAAKNKPTLSAVNFGTRPKNVPVSLDATLSNTGNADIALTLPPTVTGAAFRYKSTTCAATLVKGTSCTINVEYTPPDVSAHAGQVTVVAAGEPVSANLAGTGAEPTGPAIVFDHVSPAASDTVIPAYSGSTLAVYYRNSSAASVALTSASASGASVAFNADGSNGSCAPGRALSAGAKCWLLVGFGTSVGTQSTTLTANFAGVAPIQTALSVQQKTLSVSVTGNGASTGGTADMTVTLSNGTGGGFKFDTARWSLSSSGTGTWAVQSDNCPAVLTHGASCAAVVRYTAAGAGTGNLTLSPYGAFEWNDLLDGRVVVGSGTYRGGPASVAPLGLNATGQVAVAMDHVSPAASGTVMPVYSNSTLAVYYRNNSNSPVTLNSASSSSGSMFYDASDSASCAPNKALAAGAKCRLLVGWGSSTPGTRNATLTANFAGVATIQTVLSAVEKTLDMTVTGNGASTATSTDMTVTLSNSTGGGFKFDTARWSLGAAGTGTWAVQSDNCPAVLTNGASCTAVVRYTAAGAGAGNLTLSPYGTFEWNDLLDGRVIAGSGTYRGGPASVASLGLNATGQVAVVLDHVSPSASGTVMPVYSTSTMAVYYRNNSNVSVMLNSVSSSSSSLFYDASDSASCAPNKVLAAKATCRLLIGWGYSTAGTRNTTLTANFAGVAAIQTALSAVEKTLDVTVTGNGATTASTTDMTVTVSNSTGGSFQFGSPRWSLSSSGTGSWAVQSDNCPAVLSNGASCTAVVRYTAAGAGTGNLTLSPYGTFEWNDLLDGRVIAGSGLYRGGPASVTSLGLNATGQVAVVLDHVNPAAGGTVMPIYSTSTLAVYYRNNSNAPVMLNSLSSSSSSLFYDASDSASCAPNKALAAGAKCRVLVGWGYSTAGARNTTLTANFAGVAAIQTPLSAVEKTLDMTVTGNGATTATFADMTVTLSNSTGGGFKFSTAHWSLSSSGAGTWTVQSDNCPAVLANGASCTAVVRYTAAGTGAGNSTLSPYGTFEWNDLVDGRVIAGSGLYRGGPAYVASLALGAASTR